MRQETAANKLNRFFRQGKFGAALKKLFAAVDTGKADLACVPAAATNMIQRACGMGHKRNTNAISTEALMIADVFKQRWGSACMAFYFANHGGGGRGVMRRYLDTSEADVTRMQAMRIASEWTTDISSEIHSSMMSIRAIYRAYMTAAGLKPGSVLVKCSEDETMIRKEPYFVAVDGKADLCAGYCGPKGHTTCTPGYSHKIGYSEDRSAYDDLVRFMEESEIAPQLRVFILVPQVSPDVLPPLPIVQDGTSRVSNSNMSG